MIVTLTLNPSVDRTIEVPELIRGAVLRAVGGRVDAGGKGVNISRALARHAVPTTTVFAAGGAEGQQLIGLLEPLGVRVAAVAVQGATRANVAVVEPDGTTTKLNEQGPRLSAHEIEALLQTVIATSEPGGWVVGCGSLPPGVPDDVYAHLVTAAHAAGARVAIDTSGPALAAALVAGPDLVKPNLEELAEAVGRPLRTLGEVVAAAEDLLERGAGAVLASLGPDGAVLVEPDGARHGQAHLDHVLSTVGAGDAGLAGFVAAGGSGPEALRAALGWGSAAAGLPGSRMPGPDDVAAVHVILHDEIDLNRSLKGALDD
jgi:1-phosphofructokinase